MVKRVRARTPKPRTATLIAFPVFDDTRHRVIEWVDALEEGGRDRVTRQIAETYFSLRRVKGSQRHQRLADFLHHSIHAIETGESDSARAILLTAMAIFGWPSPGLAPSAGFDTTALHTGISV